MDRKNADAIFGAIDALASVAGSTGALLAVSTCTWRVLIRI